MCGIVGYVGSKKATPISEVWHFWNRKIDVSIQNA